MAALSPSTTSVHPCGRGANSLAGYRLSSQPKQPAQPPRYRAVLASGQQWATLGGDVSLQASIFSPEEGASISVGTSFWLQGYAYDLEDGILNESIQWTSSLDGNLGSGKQIVANLSSGQHIVTLTATDSDNNTATATVNVVVSNDGEVYLPIILK
jgi:hypothetical protein